MKAVSLFVAALLIGIATTSPSHALASLEPPGTCTVTIKGNFDGNVVDVTITVSEVNAIECALLKVGVKKALENKK